MLFVVLVGLVAGIAVSSRDFAKLQLGPLYIAEAGFILWLALSLVATPRLPISRYFSKSITLLLFFLWGAGWLFYDLGHVLSSGDPIQFMRIAQHSLLYIYPILWVTVGMSCYDQFPTGYRYIIGASLISAWPCIVGLGVTNLSLGPLMTILWVHFILLKARTQTFSSHTREFWAQAIVLTLLTCIPFWRMWTSSVQRTSFLTFLLFILLIPWMVRKSGESWVRPVKISAMLVLIYACGQMLTFLGVASWDRYQSRVAAIEPVAVEASSHETPQPVVNVNRTPSWGAHQVVMAIQHGEDRPFEGQTKMFQMRMRRFMWKTAIQDWSRRPFAGIGTVPEVPSLIQPGIPNNVRSMHGMPPIAGPHNSYLTVLARLGVVGILLLGAFFVYVGVNARRLLKASYSWEDLFLVFVPFSGVVYALFNSGFESPQNCMIMWLFIGIMLAKAKDRESSRATVNDAAKSDRRTIRNDERAKVLC